MGCRAAIRRLLPLAAAALVGVTVLAQTPPFDAAAMLDDARRLASDEWRGRRVGSPGNAAARALLVERFGEAGLQPVDARFEHAFRTSNGLEGVNVVGRLDGRRSNAPHIVVSAHYDHVGVRGGRVYNGANDNASGAAALAAIAGYFRRHPTQHPLLFVAFDAEEEGLAGARAFVARPPVPRDQLAFNLNLDMIGRDPANVLWVSGVSRAPWLRPAVGDVARRAPVDLRMGYDDPADRANDWTRQSDQWAFIDAGIPALYVGVSDFELHHHPDDDFESLTVDFYVRAVETIIELVEAIDATLATRSAR